MKKKVLSILTAVAFTAFGFSQVTLPTSNDFSGAPTLAPGWSADLTSNPTSDNFYTASGNPAPAFAFKKTGRYLIVNVASAPGEMKYDIAGNSFSGGTFYILGSVDGTIWNDTIKKHDGTNLSNDGSYVTNTVTVNPNSRFIKFIYTNKSSGNIGLDNVKIDVAQITNQALKVLTDGTQMINAGTAAVGANVGSSATLPFVVENAGSTDALVIDTIYFSGADLADFSLNTIPTYPLSIAGNGNEAIGIKFTPSSTGTKSATVTIKSNDIDFPIFTFNVNGYGDNLATEPTSQPTNLTFSNVKTWRLKADFTGNSSEGYLILRKAGSAITDVPVDGTVYNVGDMIGDAKVVRMSNSTSFVPNDIVANTQYYFSVFAYNGVGAYTNYLTTTPLTDNVTTPANMIPTGEYDNIDVNANTLINDLNGLVSPHTQQFYSNYGAYMVTKFYERDTINNMKVLTDVYTGNSLTYSAPFSHGGTGITREHTFANSWFPIENVDANFYSDYHNLFPISQDDANAIRSNYPFGVVVSDVAQSIGNSKLGKNAQGQWVYEPRDEQKGAVARAIFYMCVRYTDDNTTWKLPAVISSSITYGQNQQVLKDWNINFPPRNVDIARNDYLDSLQKNRNPFIDHPEYACYIDFTTMTYNANTCAIDTTVTDTANVVDLDLINALKLFPNPTKDFVTVTLDNGAFSSYAIFDIQGRKVRSAEFNEIDYKMINVSSLTTGVYTITVNTNKGNITKKIVIE